MRPGQEVQIAIDAYPGRNFRGHVDSIKAGSGTVFSLADAGVGAGGGRAAAAAAVLFRQIRFGAVSRKSSGRRPELALAARMGLPSTASPHAWREIAPQSGAIAR
jgi:hypothetical protein